MRAHQTELSTGEAMGLGTFIYSERSLNSEMAEDLLLDRFIHIKEDLCEYSKSIVEYLDLKEYDEENRDFPSLRLKKDLLELQSKLSILASIANAKSRKLNKVDNYVNDVIQQIFTVEKEKPNPSIQFYYELGKLAGLMGALLATINSIRFDLKKKRFLINIDNLDIL